ncbi:MAG: hypothetical protein OM95_12825 [Bdellovibrio sp. ArHS]|uniref:hypothetical protein n=1 Tax=Bdellovibrio sp. ArHS TaxID=1569284 RepID=UPI0005823E77|nr:hypothetical protein [Bdellovibrio sp. ArHS]KHD87705.1 MAG: hypothetical protein OM95_12825 [Bdellovibrio sp. ArHS]
MTTKRAFLVQAIVMMFSIGAQAETLVFHGSLAARKQCADTGGFFAKDLGCKKLNITERACAVALNVNSQGEVKSIEVETPEALTKGDARKAQYKTSVSGPYLYQDGFHAYSFKLDKSSSAEVKIASDGTGRVLAANLYFDHVFQADGSRVYKQYECRNLKRVK